ncbi:MAG: sugar ABC transporter permease [Treponema sp. CETP13]|nr:MAG: sugar ABC transporter permease [Treponema sp. CETP13]
MTQAYIKNKLLGILGFILFIIVLTPFLIVLLNSAKPAISIISSPLALPEHWSLLFKNIHSVVKNPNMRYWNAFFNSIFITAVSLILIVLFSSMAAWVLVRNKTKWSTIIFLCIVAAMTIPFQAVMLPLLSWFRQFGDFTGIKLLTNHQGLIFAYIGFGSSMSVFILHGFTKGIPFELEEAAIIDGCTTEGVFGHVVFPLLQPVQITVLILNGIWIWNDYLLPSLVLGGKVKTLPIAVMTFVGSYVKQWDLILTSTLLAMLPVIILFIFAQKYIIKGMVEGSIK